MKKGFMMKKVLCLVLFVAMSVNLLAITSVTAQAAVSGTITISGSTSVYPLLKELAAAFKKSNPNVKINFVNVTGSGSGISDAKGGLVDIGMSSRALKADEKEVLAENIICNDGIAVVVNKSNPMTNISPNQLYNVYSKSVTDWKNVSGSYTSSKKIAVYGREDGSGTRACFEDVLKNDFGLNIAANYGTMNGIIASTGAMQTSIKSNAGAIGYMSLGDMDAKQVKALKFNGVEANIYNVADGSYKMSRPFVLATKGTPNAQTRAFISWCQSNSNAQNIVAKMGFVKLGLMRIKAKSFTLNQTSLKLRPGSSASLNAKIFSPTTTTNKKLSFSSSKPAVATISSDGKVYAKSAGTATITVRTTDGTNIAKTCKVTVANFVSTVRFKAVYVSVAKGKTIKLRYTITPSNATNKKVTFKSLNKKIATVSKKGVVKGKAVGSAKIQIKTKDGNKTSYCIVTVK